MSASRTDEIEHTLQQPGVHQSWEEVYRSPENEAFYEQAFDVIVETLKAPPGSVILDVGCGSCAHSIRLVKRGYNVVAVDFSEPVLQAAEQNLISQAMTDTIKLERQNILSLGYASASFDYILCWGVLMHIPQIDQAIAELDRVLSAGGSLVLAENNLTSLQANLRRVVRLLHRHADTQMIHTQAGMEWWTSTPSGKLLTRYADISWLMGQFTRRGYTVTRLMPSQFSEFYTRVPGKALKKLVHTFNSVWFNRIKNPGLAFGNILIVQKKTKVNE
jgi:ubiquinone/menaquinone biosynthesis C-methylase UbiE